MEKYIIRGVSRLNPILRVSTQVISTHQNGKPSIAKLRNDSHGFNISFSAKHPWLVVFRSSKVSLTIPCLPHSDHITALCDISHIQTCVPDGNKRSLIWPRTLLNFPCSTSWDYCNSTLGGAHKMTWSSIFILRMTRISAMFPSHNVLNKSTPVAHTYAHTHSW
jgi:hypothetical protein